MMSILIIQNAGSTISLEEVLELAKDFGKATHTVPMMHSLLLFPISAWWGDVYHHQNLLLIYLCLNSHDVISKAHKRIFV